MKDGLIDWTATERYLKLVRWAAKRYVANNEIITRIGGNPTVYTRIERAAFDRYFPA